MNGKPPYRILSMQEINNIPWNGYNVVSTFSGCGGSCLGFKMAGFRVLWANEFLPHIREIYQSNHPLTFVDSRDIREISIDDILEIIGNQEIDCLEGSPPCVSFSMAGARNKNWGKVSQYSVKKQRTDDLFFEYIRLLRGLKPKTFVAENVEGMILGIAKGYFKIIVQELKASGYNVKVKLLDASFLGVPQKRKRLIFMGVRNDLKIEPVFPQPLPYVYSIRDALGKDLCVPPIEPETDISKYRIANYWKEIPIGKNHHKRFNLRRPDPDLPSPTILQSHGGSVLHPYECRSFSLAELKRLFSFPDDFSVVGKYIYNFEAMGRSVPPLMMYHVAQCIKQILDKANV